MNLDFRVILEDNKDFLVSELQPVACMNKLIKEHGWPRSQMSDIVKLKSRNERAKLLMENLLMESDETIDSFLVVLQTVCPFAHKSIFGARGEEGDLDN